MLNMYKQEYKLPGICGATNCKQSVLLINVSVRMFSIWSKRSLLLCGQHKRSLGKLTYSHTLTHACWQHSPGSHIHLARVFLCLPLRSREPSSCFHVPCASPGQERTHLGRAAGMSAASPALSASHTHLLWWTKLWCSLHDPCQGCWLSPKHGRKGEGGGFRQAGGFFYSTSWNWFFNFSIFSASRFVCASNWCLISLCPRQGFPVDLRMSLWLRMYTSPTMFLSDTPSLQNHTLQSQVRNSNMQNDWRPESVSDGIEKCH